jgi:hypothetical protein
MKQLFNFILLVFAISIAVNSIYAQKYVSTQPSKKNAVLEQFTGVRESFAPKGDGAALKIINNYPGRAFTVSYHPSNGDKNTPYGSEENLKRDWPSTFNVMSFAGLIDMPVAFVNRRLNNGVRAMKRDLWTSKTSEILKESSPCNVGFWGTYEKESKLLTLDVEVYFTSAVTDKYYIYVVLMQDSVVATQNNLGETYDQYYAHNNVFREALTDVWGEQITEATNAGTLITRKYTFDNTVKNYKIEKCSALVFIRNAANEEIVTGWGSKAHSDRLKLSAYHAYFAADSNDTKEQVFQIKNVSGQTGSITLTTSKSKRTPADWTAEVTVPSKITKGYDNPQDEVVSINAGDSLDVTVALKTGSTIGAGDAVLKITASNLYNETKIVQVSAISNSYEKLEILESPYDIEPASLNQIIKATGRSEFFKFESMGIGSVLTGMTNLKVVAWSFNPCDTLREEYASTLYSMLKKGINVMITGCFPFTTLYEVYAGHPLINYLGVSIDDQKGHLYGESFTLMGETTDLDFKDLNIPWKQNLKTDSLLQPLMIKKPAIASPILKIDELNYIIATKSQTAESRAVIIHVNPYSFTTSTNRQRLIDRCLDWLEATAVAGPMASFDNNELNFGDTLPGKFKNLALEITNSGEATLELSKFDFSGPDKDNFKIYSGGITGTKTLSPGSKHTVVIRFTVPANLQETTDFAAAFEISTNVMTDSVYKIPLKGRGLGPGGVGDDKENLLNVSVLPNPAGSQAVIKFELNSPNAAFVNASLIDAAGRTAKSIYNDVMQPGTFNHSLNTAGFASGTYFLVVKSNYGNYNIQVVINR